MSLVFNTCGGGGGGASLSVYGYAEEKTEAGNENDIQVYPAADMVDYVIQFEEPESPYDGLVWLQTGAGRFEFSPIDNTPMLVPIAEARIFRNGVWELVSTKLFDGAEWIPNVLRIFVDGTEYVPMNKVGTVTYIDSDILGKYVSVGGTSSYDRHLYSTLNAVNLTNISYVHIIGNRGFSEAGPFFGVDTNNGTRLRVTDLVVGGYIGGSNNAVKQLDLDVRELVGYYYLKVCASSGGNYANVLKIWGD